MYSTWVDVEDFGSPLQVGQVIEREGTTFRIVSAEAPYIDRFSGKLVQYVEFQTI